MATFIRRWQREADIREDNWRERSLPPDLTGSALDSLQRYVELYAERLGPDWAAALHGFVQSLQGQKPHPSIWYDKVFSTYPGCAYVELCMGDHHHYWSGSFHRARHHYEAASELDPGLALAHFDRGLLYQLLGVPERVVETMQRALDTAGEDESQLRARALFEMATVHALADQTRQAKELCEAALALWPEFPEATEALEQLSSAWLT